METCNDPRAFISITVLTALIEQLRATQLINLDALLAQLVLAQTACAMKGMPDNGHALAEYISTLRQLGD